MIFQPAYQEKGATALRAQFAFTGNMGSMNSVCTGANMLIPVPGDSLKVKAEDQPGPGGVLVCADSFVTYMHEGHETVQTPIPRRQNLPDKRGILLLASSMHKKSGQFVVLAQSEYGDIYKVSLVNMRGRKNGLRTLSAVRVLCSLSEFALSEPCKDMPRHAKTYRATHKHVCEHLYGRTVAPVNNEPANY
jgi:hypothetical protein